MKITVGLPSRNRPAGLLSVLTAFDALASGEHDITYAVILDDDDYVTLEQWEHWDKSGFMPANVRKFVGARVKTVNARFNDAIAQCPADLYSHANDDCFPLAFQWDKMLAGAVAQIPCFSWHECHDPGNPTYIVMSEPFRAAMGRFYPEYFPFWFADTWIAEVFTLAFAKPIGVVNQLQMGGKRGTTQGMRDLAFWFDFFTATRVERIQEAVRVAKAFHFSLNVEQERQVQLQAMKQGDAIQRSRTAGYETALGANLGEPSEVYKAAKLRAEIWLDMRAAA